MRIDPEREPVFVDPDPFRHAAGEHARDGRQPFRVTKLLVAPFEDAGGARRCLRAAQDGIGRSGVLQLGLEAYSIAT